VSVYLDYEPLAETLCKHGWDVTVYDVVKGQRSDAAGVWTIAIDHGGRVLFTATRPVAVPMGRRVDHGRYRLEAETRYHLTVSTRIQDAAELPPVLSRLTTIVAETWEADAEIRTQLTAAYDALLVAVVGLEEARLTQPGASDTWSAKDVLGHVAAWAREMLQEVELVLANQGKEIPAIEDVRAWSEREAWRRASWPLDAILAELEAVHRHALALIPRLTAEELARKGRFSWRVHPAPLQELVDAYRYHLEEHARELQAWRDQLGR